MAKEKRQPGESRDQFLARTRYADKTSASQKVREGKQKGLTVGPDAAALYDKIRNTPASQKRRANARRNPGDGGEGFADRNARSTTGWFGRGRG